MSKKYEPALTLKIKRSRQLLIFLVSYHFLGLVSLVNLGIENSFKIGLLCLVLLHFTGYMRRYWRGDYQSYLRYQEQWQWSKHGEKWQNIALLGSSVLTSKGMILHLKGENKSRRNILIALDALTAEEYRQLRVKIKLTV